MLELVERSVKQEEVEFRKEARSRGVAWHICGITDSRRGYRSTPRLRLYSHVV